MSISAIRTQCLPNEQDIGFFQENGYWLSPVIFSQAELEEITAHQDLIYKGQFDLGRAPVCNWLEGKDSPGALRKTDNSHWADSSLRKLAVDPTIGAIAGKLMKADMIRLWHDQLLYKPTRESGRPSANVGWHQDFSYWQCAQEPSLITAWVAFHDVDLTSGCIQMVQGSHKWGLLNVSDFFEQNMEKQAAEMDVPEGQQMQLVPIKMKAGQVSFHHALTIHGSGANTSGYPRRSIAIHMMTGDTTYSGRPIGEGHFNVKILGGQVGDRFEGDAFPVMYDVKASR